MTTRASAMGATTNPSSVLLQFTNPVLSGRAVDCGPLASARALEGMSAVIVNVNKRYKAHAGLRITDLP